MSFLETFGGGGGVGCGGECHLREISREIDVIYLLKNELNEQPKL